MPRDGNPFYVSLYVVYNASAGAIAYYAEEIELADARHDSADGCTAPRMISEKALHALEDMGLRGNFSVCVQMDDGMDFPDPDARLSADRRFTLRIAKISGYLEHAKI